MASYPPPYGDFDAKAEKRRHKMQRRLERTDRRSKRETDRVSGPHAPHSILGPLLVLTIGTLALLLQLGKLQLSRLLSVFSRWWPLLLVAAGVVLLLEWAWDHRQHPANPSYPRRSLGGGAVIALIFLAIAGAIGSFYKGDSTAWIRTLHVNSDDLAQFFGEKHETQQTLEDSLTPGMTFSIANPHGAVTVTGQSTDNKVHIVVSREVYAHSDEDAEQRGRELSPQLLKTDGRLSLIMPSVTGATADLAVTLPQVTPVDVDAGHGDVHAYALKGSLNVTADHGDVDLNDIDGSVSIHLNRRSSSLTAHAIAGGLLLKGNAQDLSITDVNGPVGLDGDFYGDTHLERLDGPVSFRTSRTTLTFARLNGRLDLSPHSELSANDLAGPLNLNTRSRNISLAHLSGQAILVNSNGTIDLTTTLQPGDLDIQNRGGSITLTLPPQSGFTIDARTTDGQLQNDFNLPVTSNGSRRNLEGQVGSGTRHITLSATHADIAVRKADKSD